jgi:hypothetical protein
MEIFWLEKLDGSFDIIDVCWYILITFSNVVSDSDNFDVFAAVGAGCGCLFFPLIFPLHYSNQT